MPLRRRLVLLSAAAVAVAVVAAAVVSYVVVRNELRDQIDGQLYAQARLTAGRDPFGAFGGGGPPPQATQSPAPYTNNGQIPSLSSRRGGPAGYAQFVDADGEIGVADANNASQLPVTKAVKEVASGERREVISDVDVDGEHLRMIVRHLPSGGAIQLARSLESADAVLRRLLVILIVLSVAGIALAAALGRLVARSVLAPIDALTDAAEHIELTGDLKRRIEAPGTDEVGRLAARFNAMLDRLALSLAAQRQLVADASHELRTPITSLRTNVEVLLATSDDEMDPTMRRELLEDVVEQSDELGSLVGDLIELARGDEPAGDIEDVRLDQLLEEAVARARRHHPGTTYRLDTEPTTVEGRPDRLGRAVNNLLDNAAKHGGDGAVEVRLQDGVLTVRDHGPGVPAGDREHIFDRFYRGAAARAGSGTGLGLAIVRQVAVSHGGTVEVDAPDGGGAAFVLRLPVSGAGGGWG
jgi:two-component system sensor histidine kinase MprB